MSPAVRSWTRRRWWTRSRRVGLPAPRSTSTSASRRSAWACSSSRTSSSRRTWAARLMPRARRWGCSAPTRSRLFFYATSCRRTRSTRRPGTPNDELERIGAVAILKAETYVPEQQFEDLNSGFIQELFEQYLRAPESVDPAWRALFEHTPEKLAASPVVQRVRELYPG